VEPEIEVRSHFGFLEESDELNIFGFWFWIWSFGCVAICLCFVFVFFLINILDFYLGLLILYQKAKGPKSIKFFFEK
jgi:hypothetical protein